MKQITTAALCLLTLFSCQKDVTSPEFIDDDTLPGTWLLVENGWSPGSGYVVEPVPSDPKQTITFKNDGTLSTTIESLRNHRYYRVQADTINPDVNVLLLYGTDPRNTDEKDPAKYTIAYDSGLLKLHFRWCIEGCHMGLRKLKTSDSTE